MKYLVLLFSLQFLILSTEISYAQKSRPNDHYAKLLNVANNHFNNLNIFPKPNSNKDITKIDSITNHNDAGSTCSYKYSYDNNGKAASYIMKALHNNIWENLFRETYSYDSLGNILRIVTDSWDNANWGNFMIQDYVYEKDNIIDISKLFTNNNWQNLIKTTTLYSNGFKISSLTETWSDSVWINEYRSSWNYSPNNKLSDGLLEQWDASVWNNKIKFTYDYNKDSAISSILDETWVSNNWDNYALTALSYSNNGHQIDGLFSFWDGSQWATDSRYTYLFNDNNCFIYGKHEIFNNGAWLSGDGVINVTNPDGFDQHYLANEVIVSYANINSIKNESGFGLNGYTFSQNYPNPFNPSTTIKYQLPKSGNVTLKVYDLLGREVAALVNEYKSAGTYSVSFNASALPTGIYFYKLESAQFTQVKKMMLLK